MSALVLRVRGWVGRQWRRLVVTAAVVGIVGGLALGVAAGTRRTASAPDRYTRHAGGDPDLLLTQLGGAPLDRAVAALPAVRSAQSLIFVPSFPLSPLDGRTLVDEPNSFAGDDSALGRRIVEGR